MKTDEAWQRCFREATPDAFSLAKQRMVRQPLVKGDVVSWMEDGLRLQELAFELVAFTNDGKPVIQGTTTGAPADIRILSVPASHIVRARDFLDIVTDLIQQRGTYERTQTGSPALTLN